MNRTTAKDVAKPAQELPGMAEVRAEFGLEELPAGAAALSPKELLFVQALLRTGSKKKSALAAGYSERSAGQMASELLTKPHVVGFYRRCLERLGADTKAAVARTEERARMFHHAATEATDGSETQKENAKLALDHDKVLLATNAKTKLELSGAVDGVVTPALMDALTRLREETLRNG